MNSSPCRQCRPIASWLAIVPDGTKRAASFPRSSAMRASSRLTDGSSPKTSSPTSAAAIACRMPGPGRVTVSERRSMIRMRGLYSARMARESRIQTRARVVRILDALRREMPDARIQLDFGTPIQLLVSVILSAQCTDVRVNQVTPALFARYPDVAAFAHADRAELESLIRTCGLFRAKAKAIVSASRAILEEHGGLVPSSRETLEQLPG